MIGCHTVCVGPVPIRVHFIVFLRTVMIAMFNRLLKQPFFPGALQWLSVLVFVPVLGGLLFGPAEKGNYANLLVWLIWWPLLCVLFIVAGRVWCGVCPFSKLSDAIQRLCGLRFPVPDFLKQHGSSVIVTAFLLLTWFQVTTGIVESPRRTAVMLLAILTGALAFGLFFRGRTWCRYVCPIGSISQVYARASLFKLRAQEGICADCTTKDCMVPSATYSGCPMHLTPFAMESVTHCNVCSACVKQCTHGALELQLEAPSRDLEQSSAVAPVVLYLVPFLAGIISFLNAKESGRLPLEHWLEQVAYPVLCKSVLLAAALAVSLSLVRLAAYLAADGDDAERSAPTWLALGARPAIPLLLLSHLGHVSSELWSDGADLLEPLAEALQMPILVSSSLWGADWTAYLNPLAIGTGLLISLLLLVRTARRRVGIVRWRFVFAFGLYYAAFAAWNLFVTWPLAEAAVDASALVDATPFASDAPGGWDLLWPFVGINTALLVLALIAGRSTAAVVVDDFSAKKTWTTRDGGSSVQDELLEWLVVQAVQARWQMPPAVALANAGQEVIEFLKRALPPGSLLTVTINLRKNKGVLTIAHGGRPLDLPDYSGAPLLDAAPGAELEGIELRLATRQVEHLSYQARLSDGKCIFTLRQTVA